MFASIIAKVKKSFHFPLQISVGLVEIQSTGFYDHMCNQYYNNIRFIAFNWNGKKCSFPSAFISSVECRIIIVLYRLNFQSHYNLDALIISTFEMFCTLVVLFVTSELGERISSEFEDINNQINRFDWYLCPINMQKMLPVIMTNLQQPVEFKCFGSIACNRDTFKAVSWMGEKNLHTSWHNFIDHACFFFFFR